MENTIENFIQQVVGNKKLEENTFVDVKDKDIKIKSLNTFNRKIEYKKVLKIIRKKDCETYTVETVFNSIKVTKDHKFYIKLEKDPFYATLSEILKINGTIWILSDNGWQSIVKITPNKGKKEIYDLEVEGNHNLFTNHLLSHNSMGEPTTTTGGKAIKFYADVRWKVWKMNDKINELNKTTVDVIKNKLASPFGQAKFAIQWGHGIDKLSEIIDYAVDFDFVKKGGAGWFTLDDGTKLQGMDKMKDHLEENYEELLALEQRVVNRLNNIEVEEIEVIEEVIENNVEQVKTVENEY